MYGDVESNAADTQSQVSAEDANGSAAPTSPAASPTASATDIDAPTAPTEPAPVSVSASGSQAHSRVSLAEQLLRRRRQQQQPERIYESQSHRDLPLYETSGAIRASADPPASHSPPYAVVKQGSSPTRSGRLSENAYDSISEVVAPLPEAASASTGAGSGARAGSSAESASSAASGAAAASSPAKVEDGGKTGPLKDSEPLRTGEHPFGTGAPAAAQTPAAPRPGKKAHVPSPGARVVVADNYAAQNPQELTITENEVLTVVIAPRDKQWWKVKNSRGASGFVPCVLLEFVEKEHEGAGSADSAEIDPREDSTFEIEREDPDAVYATVKKINKPPATTPESPSRPTEQVSAIGTDVSRMAAADAARKGKLHDGAAGAPEAVRRLPGNLHSESDVDAVLLECDSGSGYLAVSTSPEPSRSDSGDGYLAVSASPEPSCTGSDSGDGYLAVSASNSAEAEDGLGDSSGPEDDGTQAAASPEESVASPAKLLGQSKSLRLTGLSDPNITNALSAQAPVKTNSLDNLETPLDDPSLKRTPTEWNLLQVDVDPTLGPASIRTLIPAGSNAAPPTAAVHLCADMNTNRGPDTERFAVIRAGHVASADRHAALRTMMRRVGEKCVAAADDGQGAAVVVGEEPPQIHVANQAVHVRQGPSGSASLGVPAHPTGLCEGHRREEQGALTSGGPSLPPRQYIPSNIQVMLDGTEDSAASDASDAAAQACGTGASADAMGPASATSILAPPLAVWHCDLKHEMPLSTHSEGDYSRGWVCDYCKTHNQTRTPRYWCSICSTDYCVSCISVISDVRNDPQRNASIYGDDAVYGGLGGATAANQAVQEDPAYASMTGGSLVQGRHSNAHHGYARIQGSIESGSSGDGSAGRLPAGLRRSPSRGEDHYATIGSSSMLALRSRGGGAGAGAAGSIQEHSGLPPALIAALARRGHLGPSRDVLTNPATRALYMRTNRQQWSSSHPHALQDRSRSITGWRCDGCDRVDVPAPGPAGSRFRCGSGCDYDLCRRCMIETIVLSPSDAPLPDDGGAAESGTVASPVLPPPRPPVANHEDTAPGSLHYFEDENGTRQYYQFGREGSVPETPEHRTPTSPPAPPVAQSHRPTRHMQRHPNNVSVLQQSLANVPMAPTAPRQRTQARRAHPGPRPTLTPGELRQFLADLHQHEIPPTPEERNLLISRIVARVLARNEPEPPLPIMEYTMTVFRHSFKILMNRATLMTMLDRNKYPNVEAPLAVVLAVATTICGFELVAFYSGVGTVILWFVVASAQYSLLKSVQSDPGSSLLGERGIGFARAIYIVLFGAIVFAIDAANFSGSAQVFEMEYSTAHASEVTKQFFLMLILTLPLIWLFGHLPMWARTLFHHILEQLDIILGGGGGSITLKGALARSLCFCIAFSTSTGICYMALDQGSPHGGTDSGVFSAFIGVTTAAAFLLSRLPSDPKLVMNAIRGSPIRAPYTNDAHHIGRRALLARRLAWDLCLAVLIGTVAAVLHLAGLFGVRSDAFAAIIHSVAIVLGIVLHYFIPEMQKTYPWRSFNAPLLARHLSGSAVPRTAGKRAKRSAVGVLEQNTLQRWLQRGGWCEAYILWPMVILPALTRYGSSMITAFGPLGASMLLALTALKLLRLGYTDRTMLWACLMFALLFFRHDFDVSEGLPIDLFVSTVIVNKICGLYLRLSFAYAYCAPWNIKDILGSSFHAISMPLHIPHAAMLVFQSIVATFVSAPVYPVMGSYFFLVSYFRPIKFFERHYATKPMDYGDAMQDPSKPRPKHVANASANNLNSVFYHYLVRRLESQLCTDIGEGKFGTVEAGDVFVLTDMEDGEGNNMAAFVHIIDVGNGFVSFQLRGLEFVGTFCQAREQDALRISHREDKGVFSKRSESCKKHCSRMLPVSTALQLRWQTWASINECYTVLGYSIAINNAESMFQSFDQQKLLITRLSQAVIHYVVRHPNLAEWMTAENVREKLADVQFSSTEGHRLMSSRIDQDYDSSRRGISLHTFGESYLEWIGYCNGRRDVPIAAASLCMSTDLDDPLSDDDATEELVKFCFLLVTFARIKFLSKCKRHGGSSQAEIFLHGYHAVFGGDFSPSTPGDAWIFQRDALILGAILPGVRMALKLHQDEYVVMGEYEDHEALFDAITDYDDDDSVDPCVVRAETDPKWTEAILASKPSLVSLRWNNEDSSNNKMFFISVITKRVRDLKIFKLNSECVRGLWASQQQELLFFKNTYTERGSIQKAPKVLRNMISQSCDEPIGYPIFVSELTHSFSEAVSHSPWQMAVYLAKRLGSSISSHMPVRRSSSGTSAGSDVNVDKGDTDLSATEAGIEGYLQVDGQDIEAISALPIHEFQGDTTLYSEHSFQGLDAETANSPDNEWDEADAVALKAVLQTSLSEPAPVDSTSASDSDSSGTSAAGIGPPDAAAPCTSDDILPAPS